MTTAAKRAKKKANRLKEQASEIVADLLNSAPSTTESEHAATLLALAKLRKLRNKLRGADE